MTKIDKLARVANEEYRDLFDEAFHAKFGICVKTTYNFVGGNLITVRGDGKKLTKEHEAWGKAYSDGAAAILNLIRNFEYRGK